MQAVMSLIPKYSINVELHIPLLLQIAGEAIALSISKQFVYKSADYPVYLKQCLRLQVSQTQASPIWHQVDVDIPPQTMQHFKTHEKRTELISIEYKGCSCDKRLLSNLELLCPSTRLKQPRIVGLQRDSGDLEVEAKMPLELRTQSSLLLRDCALLV